MAEEEQNTEQEEQSPQKKILGLSPKILIIIAAVLLLIIIGAASYFFLFAGDDEADPTLDAEQTEIIENETDAEQISSGSDNEQIEMPIVDETTDTSTAEQQTNTEPAVTDETAMNASTMDEQTNPDASVAMEDAETPANPATSTASSASANDDYDPLRDRLAGISQGVKESGGFNMIGIKVDDNNDLPKFEDIPMPEDDLELEVKQTAQDKVIEEFGSLKAMADEIIRLRKKQEMLERETKSAYAMLEEQEKELKIKNKIIRAQDSFYTNGGTIKKKRDDSPVPTPDLNWDIAPKHEGP